MLIIVSKYICFLTKAFLWNDWSFSWIINTNNRQTTTTVSPVVTTSTTQKITTPAPVVDNNKTKTASISKFFFNAIKNLSNRYT